MYTKNYRTHPPNILDNMHTATHNRVCFNMQEKNISQFLSSIIGNFRVHKVNF